MTETAEAGARALTRGYRFGVGAVSGLAGLALAVGLILLAMPEGGFAPQPNVMAGCTGGFLGFAVAGAVLAGAFGKPGSGGVLRAAGGMTAVHLVARKL